MRIVSNDSLVVDSSETEPILSQIAIIEESEDTSPSTEITASEDCLETAADLPGVGVDPIQYLSHAELSQCRICLDNEGVDYALNFLYTFLEDNTENLFSSDT